MAPSAQRWGEVEALQAVTSVWGAEPQKSKLCIINITVDFTSMDLGLRNEWIQYISRTFVSQPEIHSSVPIRGACKQQPLGSQMGMAYTSLLCLQRPMCSDVHLFVFSNLRSHSIGKAGLFCVVKVCEVPC